MRWLTLIAALFGGFARVPAAAGAPPASAAYHIVLARSRAGAGEHVELRLVPPPPEAAILRWTQAEAAPELGQDVAIYRAPYVIAPGTPPAHVSAGLSYLGARSGASVDIELEPGSLPGA